MIHTLSFYYHALLERHVHRRRRASVLIRPIIRRDVRGRPLIGSLQTGSVQRDPEARSIWKVDAAVRRKRLVREQPPEVGHDRVAARREVDELGHRTVRERVLEVVRVDRGAVRNHLCEDVLSTRRHESSTQKHTRTSSAAAMATTRRASVRPPHHVTCVEIN